jgi:drug/metabolite transporter (DMT)-like permease
MSDAASGASQNVIAGTVLIVVAFFFVAVMSAFGKAAASVPASVLVFFQNAISLVIMLPWMLAHGGRALKTERLPLHIVRALSGMLSQALFFVAVKHMSLVDAVLLVNAAPLFIPFVVLVWLRTPIATMVWAGLVIGFAGVLLILHPSPALLENPAAVIAAAAALFSAIALVTVNQLSSTDQPNVILFYYFLISTIAAAPLAIFGWSTPDPQDWWFLIGVGVSMAMAQLFIILAYRHASAQSIAPFNYSVVVFSGLIGWLVWNHVPDRLALLGIVLVCAGGIVSIMFGGRPMQGHSLGHGHWRLHAASGRAGPGERGKQEERA